ncbi:hypothetical protein ACLMJK_003136 [Lecanora helva]
MPSFYPTGLSGQMPPTPPEYYGVSSSGALEDRQLPALQMPVHSARVNDFDLGASEKRETMSQNMMSHPFMTTYPTLRQNADRNGSSGFAASTRDPPNSYGHMANAPLLPPIRVPNQSLDECRQDPRSKHAPTMSHPSEEKPTGGVAAHLDYEMEDMVNFVSETAQGMYDSYRSGIWLADIDISRSIVEPKTPVHPDFRKFVSQVLASTRLPKSTILLAIQYLATRMTLLSNQRQSQCSHNSVYSMLTTALLLGSKFLDDNTFQNRSWSEVSNIAIGDLNRLEREWLVAIDYRLHVVSVDPEGFELWSRHWQRYQVRKANRIEPLVRSLNNMHLDKGPTQQQRSVHRLLSSPRYAAFYPERFMVDNFKDNAGWAAPHYNSWPNLQSPMDYSPPSAPETGPNTPDRYEMQNAYGYRDHTHSAHHTSKLPTPSQLTSINPTPMGLHLPYTQQYHPYNRGSSYPYVYDSSHYERFMIPPAPAYGLQPVYG